MNTLALDTEAIFVDLYRDVSAARELHPELDGLLKWLFERSLYVCCLLYRLSGQEGFGSVYVPSAGLLRFARNSADIKGILDAWRALPQAFQPNETEEHEFAHNLEEALRAEWPRKDLGAQEIAAGKLASVFTDAGAEPTQVWIVGLWALGKTAPSVRVLFSSAHLPGSTAEAVRRGLQRARIGADLPVEGIAAAGDLVDLYLEPHIDLTEAVKAALASRMAPPEEELQEGFSGELGEVRIHGRGARGPADWTLRPFIDADLWTENQRRTANVAALRTAAKVGSQAPETIGAAERSIIATYSGWGGVNWQKIPDDVRPERAAGILYEYYTPTRFCRAVWHVLERLHEAGFFPPQVRALEPSAGIGRFIGTGPLHLDWTAVELAPESAQLFRLLFPEVELHQTAFERYAIARDRGLYDLIVANPPYTGRGSLLNVDPQGKRWDQEAHYFLDAGSRMLAPGGVMVQLVPLGALQGVTAIKLREALLKRCRFLGAYMPPSELFPGARLNLGLQFWWRRPQDLPAIVDEYDKAVLHGRYPTSEEGKANTGGVWGPAARQGRRPGQKEAMEVHGDFDPEHLARMVLRGVPADELEAAAGMREAAHAVVRRETAKDRRASAAVAAEDAIEDPVYGSARRLGARVHRFFDVAKQDINLAETARPELLSDVQAWIARNGNPHTRAALRNSRERDVLALLAAVKGNGTLAAGLLEPPADLLVTGFRGRRDDLFDVADYMARQKGSISFQGLRTLYQGDPAATASDPRWSEWALVMEVGAWAMQPKQIYLSGDLYGRLEELGKGGARADWQRRQEDMQREWLIEAIGPLPMSDIDADLRTHWIPLEALEEYLTEANFRERPVLEWDEGYLVGTGVQSEEVWKILAYINRESKIDVEDSDGNVARKMRQIGEIETRIEDDKQADAKWLAWLREHPRWSVEVAEIYNRLFRGKRPYIPSSEPIPIARASPKVKLKPHQNNGIRTITAMGGGLVAHEVGLGKTYFALGLIAWWRQLLKAKRPIIVVPKQVIVNWLLEARRLLPDYDILTIGVTEANGVYVEDSKATKGRKWHEYAQGQHELCIVTMPAFLDVAVSPGKKKEIFEGSIWFQREEKIAVKEETFQEKVIQQAKVELDGARRDLSEQIALFAKGKPESASSRYGYKTYYEREREKEYEKAEKEVPRLKKKIAKLEADIARKEAKLGDVPAGTRALEEARQAYEEFVARRELTQGDAIWWEDIKCDCLVFDEAQALKNLWAPEARYGQVPKYLGAPTGDTKRCWDFYAKAMVVRELTGDTGIVLLTGTPLSNSPLELYPLIGYIRPKLWTERGIINVEAYIDRFLNIESDLFVTPVGKVEQGPIVAGFKNLGELRGLLALIMDYRTAEDVGLRVPELDSEYVDVPMQDGAEELYEILRAKAEEAVKSKTGETEEGEHFLSIMDQMHKAAQDLRLIDFDLYKDNETPPKYLAVGERIKLTCDYSGKGCMPACAHLVFVDSVAAHGWLQDSLVEQGIPRDRIARLSGKVDLEDRQAIIDGLNGEWEYEDGRWVALREPIYDVVIGNSPVMAEGINAQTRGCAVHHVEMPWEPKTITQRNGRIRRQGNKSNLLRTGAPPDSDLGTVKAYYYQTRRSFDAYRVQLVSGKRGWQATLLRGAEGSMNNPMAGAKMSADDWLLALAADPEQARIRLQAVQVAHRMRRLNRQRNEAATALIRYAGYVQSIKRVRSPDLLFQYKREMSRLKDYLTRLSDDVFSRKDLIARAGETEFYYEAGHDFAWIQGDVLCLQPKAGKGTGIARLRLLSVSDVQRALVLRIEGEWFARQMTVDAIWQQGEIAHDCAPWDTERDERRRHQTVGFDWQNIARVPDDLLQADAAWMWEHLIGSYSGSTIPTSQGYPTQVGDSIVFVPWNERKAERPPVMPTREGLISFLKRWQGDKKTRRALLDGWFQKSTWQINQIRREAGISGEEEIEKVERPEKEAKPKGRAGKEKGSAASNHP